MPRENARLTGLYSATQCGMNPKAKIQVYKGAWSRLKMKSGTDSLTAQKVFRSIVSCPFFKPEA